MQKYFPRKYVLEIDNKRNFLTRRHLKELFLNNEPLKEYIPDRALKKFDYLPIDFLMNVIHDAHINLFNELKAKSKEFKSKYVDIPAEDLKYCEITDEYKNVLMNNRKILLYLYLN